MKVIVIAALAANRIIGVNNTLPWKLSADLKRFKALTTGHTIVMGRKTFESLGKPLPGRRHICVSRASPSDQLQPDTQWPEQVFWCGDLSRALQILAQEERAQPEAPVFIIGGADIYRQALPLADALELTHIHASYEGDAAFPVFEAMFEKESEQLQEENGLSFSFARYRSVRPQHITVRPARDSDADFITAAQVQMAQETEALHLDPTRVAAGVRAVLHDSSKGRYLVALNALTQRPVGCLLLQNEWSDWRNGHFLWIHSLFVIPDERNKGIFRWMYRVVQCMAQTESALGLRLYVEKENTRAHAVYNKCKMHLRNYDIFETEFSPTVSEH